MDLISRTAIEALSVSCITRSGAKSCLSCNSQLQLFSYWLVMVDIDLERRETEHGCSLNFGLLNGSGNTFAHVMIGWYFQSTFNNRIAIIVFLTTST